LTERRVRGAWLAGCALALAAFAITATGAAAQTGLTTTSVSFPDDGSGVDKNGDTIMTRQQAKELLSSVDTVMGFVSADTGLPAVPHVKRRLISRDEVNHYLIKNFDEDESSKRLQRSEIVLKKFGLLANDFDLRPFLLSLLTEQIAGFYDDRTKSVNLLNWVGADVQKPVLAHELTHAVQDKKVGLEKWSEDGLHGNSKNAAEDNERVGVDELETARQAVAEGQAMLVFLDWSIREQSDGKDKQTLAESPELWDKVKDEATDTTGSPVMARAPLVLQRSLEFPYVDGLAFEHTLATQAGGWKAGGQKLAFDGALEHPPSSSFEIMTPHAYLAHAPVPVLRLPDVHPLLDPEYEPYDVGVMGELDVEMMASLFGGPEIGKSLAPEWNGGVYYAGQRKDAPDKKSTASLGIFYLSHWKAAEAATGFARLYEAQLARKYEKVVERKQDEADSRELVYTTDEGDVLISRSGTSLFIAEGFPLAIERKLRDSADEAQATGPVRLAAGPELTFGLAQGLSRYGLLKCVLDADKHISLF
jgi:hypothetical protein